MEILTNNEDYLSETTANSSSRLMIHKLELENFKSYGGKKIIGPFHKSFTAIIGPNGSGKSNVIDAMLFVFGKRARHMRLNKVSELVHNSKQYSNCDKTRVSVYFQEIIDSYEDEKGYIITPNSELIITREAFRYNEQTKYYINGKSSSYSEVTGLLNKKGTDLEHNRFLILQGEVELIAQMKPKASNVNEDGLLEYLEDVIGTNKFIPEIARYTEELEQLNELRQETLNRMKLAEKELINLETPYNAAIEFFTTEREIYIMKLLLLTQNIKQYVNKVDELRKELDTYIDAKEKIVTSIKALEDEKGTLEGESEALVKKVRQSQDKIEQKNSEFKRIIMQDEEVRITLKHSRDRLSKQKEQLENEKRTIPELDKRRKELERLIVECKKQIPIEEKQLEIEQDKLDKLQRDLKDNLESIRKRKDDAEKELAPLKSEILSLQQKYDMLQTDIELLNDKKERKYEKEKLNKKNQDHSKDRLAKLDEAKLSASKNLSKKQETLQAIKRNNEELNEKLKILSFEISQKQVELEEARSAYQNTESTDKTIISKIAARNTKHLISDEIMRYFSKKKKTSIYGRLRDLGSIDNKYQLALNSSTSQLDNIVVDSTEDAQEVVEFIRSENLGRVTCIILDKISLSIRKNMEKDTKIHEGATRLIDLINVNDPKYKIAWYYALRDTLIAENLDHASSIAFNGKQRWRVVTINGEIIDSSGTLTGGGINTTYKQGIKCNFKQNPKVISTFEDIQNLEKQLSKLLEDQRQVKNEYKNKEEEMQSLTNEISEMNISLEKIILEYTSILGYIGQSQKDGGHGDEEEESIKYDLELERLIPMTIKLNEQINNIRNTARCKQEVVDRLNEEMKNIGGPRMKKQIEIVEKLSKSVQDLQTVLNGYQVEVNMSEKKQKKLQQSVEQINSKCQDLGENIEDLQKELLQLEEIAVRVMKEKSETEEDLKIYQEDYKVFQNKSDQLDEQIKNLEIERIDFSNKIYDIQQEINEVELTQIKVFHKRLLKLRQDASSIPEIPKARTDTANNQISSEMCKDETFKYDIDNNKDQDLEYKDHLKDKILREDLNEDEVRYLMKYIDAPSIERIKSKIDFLEVQLQLLYDNRTNKNSNKIPRPSADIFIQYSNQLEVHRQRNREVEEATTARDECKKQLDALKLHRHMDFMNGFKIISSQLKEIYQMITLGGDAELEVIDSTDPFADGILFSVRPPKKSWRPIQNLSGGEKTLSSLALVFALHQYRPSPIYFMDEVDAALDFRNVSIIATFIKENTKNAQFIVVSLRNHMFEVADRLVGIYKTYDITKSVTIDPSLYFLGDKQDKTQTLAPNHIESIY
ncbi:structural maintenance of chromosomes protein [Cryptosporidium andersoni]|uniref:Structural maintenance of chromosomes protein n=1 Tax=Cryptosporidium andersoni TaxID=117008 RepID=A0A1J4MNK2_9CRYT|nr:structural maintenance of chromosomes protein [Cryptosporidium andersoni]